MVKLSQSSFSLRLEGRPRSGIVLVEAYVKPHLRQIGRQPLLLEISAVVLALSDPWKPHGRYLTWYCLLPIDKVDFPLAPHQSYNYNFASEHPTFEFVSFPTRRH